jgi:hypothetical protein
MSIVSVRCMPGRPGSSYFPRRLGFVKAIQQLGSLSAFLFGRGMLRWAHAHCVDSQPAVGRKEASRHIRLGRMPGQIRHPVPAPHEPHLADDGLDFLRMRERRCARLGLAHHDASNSVDHRVATMSCRDRSLRIDRVDCMIRCSFSTRAKRTCSSPPSPNPTPGLTVTPASRAGGARTRASRGLETVLVLGAQTNIVLLGGARPSLRVLGP